MAAPSPQLKPATATINQHKSPPQSQNATPKRDVTILNQPSHTARQGISQIFDVLLAGTPYMRQLLLQEADVIYECKACRSLFRGLINFVDHKKNFCTLRVGPENVVAAQSAPTGLQRWMCQDKEPIPVIIPESPDEEDDPKLTNVKKKINKTPKKQMVIRKPETTYILVRPISGTTKAMEQMIIKPDQIIHQSHLDMLSNFKTPRNDGTSKLVGEIAIRQAKKAANSAKTSPEVDKEDGVEKRKTLHDLLTKVKVSSSFVNSVSATSPPTSPSRIILPKSKASSGSSKQLLMVTLGQQKKQASKQASNSSNNKKKAVCKICKKECVNFTALAWHERVHKKPSFKCALCESTSQSMYNLKRHLLNVHHLSPTKVESMMKFREQKFKVQVKDIGKQQKEKEESSPDEDSSSEEDSDSEDSSSEEEEAGGETPTCSVCQKTFASKRNVNRHMKIHAREGHVANNKKLSSEQIAKNRVLAIMDEKKLKCRKCHKTLSGLRRLQQHCCNHFKLNRYRCSLCPYENSDYTQMRRHVMGKHGRQFRTINQISEAIKKMKVGLWVNLLKADNVEEEGNQTDPKKEVKKSAEVRRNSEESSKKVDTKKSEITHREFASKKSDSKTDKLKNGDSDKPQSSKITMPTIAVERSSRSRDSSNDRSMDSSSIPNTPPKLTPIKKDCESSSKTTEIVLRNSSSRSSSPASARVKFERPESPKRDTPIRQARLNHRSVSSNVAQNLNLDDEENDNKSQMSMLMDRRQIRCVECNKRFIHLSSLRRHVHTHLEEAKSASGNRSSPAKSSRADENAKVKTVDDFINVSQLKCTKCHKRFDTMTSLKRHVARHLGYSTYKCRHCSYISRNYTWFKKHLQLSHPTVVKSANAFGSLMASMRVMMK